MKNINKREIIVTNKINNLERSYVMNRLQCRIEKYRILFGESKNIPKIYEYNLYTGKKKIECTTTITFSVKEVCHAKLG